MVNHRQPLLSSVIILCVKNPRKRSWHSSLGLHKIATLSLSFSDEKNTGAIMISDLHKNICKTFHSFGTAVIESSVYLKGKRGFKVYFRNHLEFTIYGVVADFDAVSVSKSVSINSFNPVWAGILKRTNIQTRALAYSLLVEFHQEWTKIRRNFGQTEEPSHSTSNV